MEPQKIIELRNRLKMSQEAFGHLLGVSIVTINRWENGRCKPHKIYIKEMKKFGGETDAI